MEGVIMRRPLLIFGWLTVILASAAILMFTEILYAQNQTWPEPMLEGVTYSQMAQWSFTYGGGAFYGGACPPMPQAGICYPGEQEYMGPPPFAKKKGRRRRK
jgi:hypothetical protein